jgi:hypothetical protein
VPEPWARIKISATSCGTPQGAASVVCLAIMLGELATGRKWVQAGNMISRSACLAACTQQRSQPTAMSPARLSSTYRTPLAQAQQRD